jgi:hypothetical protein
VAVSLVRVCIPNFFLEFDLRALAMIDSLSAVTRRSRQPLLPRPVLLDRFYIGEIKYKGEVFPGEQAAILDRKLFDAVQTKLDQQRTNHTKARQQSDSLLLGRIFDDRGNRMTPTYAIKNGVRYRYYISAPLIQGQSDKAAHLNRVPAIEIEKLIVGAVRKHLWRSLHRPWWKPQWTGACLAELALQTCAMRPPVGRDNTRCLVWRHKLWKFGPRSRF